MGKFPVTADVSGTCCTPPLRELLAASGCHGYELSGSLPTHTSLWRSVISGRKEHWFQHNWGLSTLSLHLFTVTLSESCLLEYPSILSHF